ncbi:EpsG family protein [Bacillus dakarensis]|uniref:EpsG family protein n=1 Tax=Robertmurraya dakarensis TaxID=1926278 RepID=UPI000981B15C|nr:EpsG family protein [Bacillus dakarensis]
MTVLWINLTLVYFFSFFSRYFSVPSLSNISSIKPNKLMIFMVMLTIVLVSGLRRNIGDTYFYRHIYDSNEFTWEYVLSQKDIGFGIMQMLLQQISDDSQIMVFITALITNVLIIIVLYKYSRLPELALYVYITSGMHIVSMNGIRQFLAAAILFTATKYLFEGDFKKYALIILFASFFHQSALILIPIYFIVRRKAWTGTTFMMLLLAIVFTLGFDKFSQILFGAIEDTTYGDYESSSEGGANIIRVMVYAAPVILAYFGREKLRIIFPQGDYIVNMSLLAVVFMIIATQNWIFARFTIYFGLYQLILISWVPKLFTENSQRLVYYLILICYFLYFYLDAVLTMGIQYRSDFIG